MLKVKKVIKDKFDKIYEKKSIIIKQKASYMILISIMTLFLSTILIITNYPPSYPRSFLFIALITSLIVLFLIFKGKFIFAQGIFWIFCINELFYILNPSSPDLIIIPEISAITFILILISTNKIQKIGIIIFAIVTTSYRIYLNQSNIDLPATYKREILLAYACLMAIFICLYLVALIIRKSIRNQELLLQDQKKILKVYKKIYYLENSLKKKEETISTIKDRLYIDQLTKLFNRNAFDDLFVKHIHHCKRHKIPSTLTFIDLDQLKYVNDNINHNAGDKYLKKIAEEIGKNIRTEDMAFRIGGDEFVILFENCTFSQSQAVIERIKKTFYKSTKNIGKNNINGSFSYGSIDILENQDLDPDQLLMKADVLMLKDKDARNITRGNN